MVTQDEQYLDLLSIFHYVVAGLTALFSSVFLIHVGIGIAMVSGAFEGGDPAARVFGWVFIIFPSVLILGGWALAVVMVMAGGRLKKRVSRMFCMVVAGCECVLMPFGTVLGVFTIIVLMKDSVKELFAANEATQGTS